MPKLDCKRVRFYSDADETVFFAFARSITAVKRIEGSGESILLHVTSRPSRRSLRDLKALFVRYRVRGKEQLAQFTDRR